jgi:AraC-like DNA-binding protein
VSSSHSPSYEEFAPPPVLRRFVHRFWVHRIDGPPPPEGRRLLPDGRINLVWVAETGVRVAGPQTRYGEPLDLPRILAFGAAFHPGAAAPLLRTPAAAFVDDHVALDAVDPRLAARVDERLGDARDLRAAVAAFADELSRSLAGAAPPDPIVRHAVGVLDRAKSTVADAAERVAVSERELERRFADHVGYAPKTLQRVLRFDRFLKRVADPAVGLAGAAAFAGYADQAHLSRETRRLADLTPRQLTRWQH